MSELFFMLFLGLGRPVRLEEDVRQLLLLVVAASLMLLLPLVGVYLTEQEAVKRDADTPTSTCRGGMVHTDHQTSVYVCVPIHHY